MALCQRRCILWANSPIQVVVSETPKPLRTSHSCCPCCCCCFKLLHRLSLSVSLALSDSKVTCFILPRQVIPSRPREGVETWSTQSLHSQQGLCPSASLATRPNLEMLWQDPATPHGLSVSLSVSLSLCCCCCHQQLSLMTSFFSL